MDTDKRRGPAGKMKHQGKKIHASKARGKHMPQAKSRVKKKT